jgi:type III secretion system FlhB-like substrate exporter
MSKKTTLNRRYLATAVEYDPSRMKAPEISAHAQRKVALEMKRIARRYGIPAVRDNELVKELHAIEEQSAIPEDLYSPVARVLARYGKKR